MIHRPLISSSLTSRKLNTFYTLLFTQHIMQIFHPDILSNDDMQYINTFRMEMTNPTSNSEAFDEELPDEGVGK